MSETAKEDSAFKEETLKTPFPLLHDWKLGYGPDTPFMNIFKDKVLVYEADPENITNDSMNIEEELPYTEKSRESFNYSSANKKPRLNNEENLDAVISEYDIPINKPLENSEASSANGSPTKSRRTLPNLMASGGSNMIRAAPFSSPNRTNPVVNSIRSNVRTLPGLNPSFKPSTNNRTNNVERKAEHLTLFDSLSDEQKIVYKYVLEEDKNVFYSGSAGTGKTILLKAIISGLQSKYDAVEVAVTASTGIAAVNIQGVTIHRFARVGLGDKSVEQYVAQYNSRKNHTSILNKVRVLIVDEISMVDGDLLDKIEAICRIVRKNENKAFGGIKVVFCGDFFQLPPVNKRRMAFEASCWNRVIDKIFILKSTFRQKDPQFIQILDEVRRGHLSAASEATLKSLNRTPNLGAGIEPTELYSLVRDVEKSNMDKLQRLPGDVYQYNAIDSDESPQFQRELENIRAPKVLFVKKDAQVMLIKNLSPTLVNGSVGKVIGFEKIDDFVYPIVQFLNGESRTLKRRTWSSEKGGKKVIVRRQIPLVLAYAVSIHKSQGQTIEFVKVNLNNTFEEGQVYVALSRATKMENLQVLNFKQNAIKVNKRVIDFYKNYE